MKLPKILRADMERAFIHAYYRCVCGCKTLALDLDIFPGSPWVAVAGRADQIWMMDFSSHYEFPVDSKPATVVRRMQKRAAAAVEDGASLARMWREPGTEPLAEITYEVWCFMPVSDRLLTRILS